MTRLTFRRPDDWHVHFRDGPAMQAVVPHTARAFGRAIVMPNLTPPVTTTALAAAYRDRILAAVPAGFVVQAPPRAPSRRNSRKRWRPWSMLSTRGAGSGPTARHSAW